MTESRQRQDKEDRVANTDDLTIFKYSHTFTYGDFNKSGTVDLWRVAKISESGNARSIQQGMEKSLQLSATIRIFMRYQVIHLSEEFHDTVTSSTLWDLTSWWSYIGKTSYCIDSVLRQHGTGLELASFCIHAVRVDLTVRRPIQLPMECVSRYGRTVSRSRPPTSDLREAAPRDGPTYLFSTRALPSETDANQHVNHTAFIKYCIDCASLAAIEGGVLSHFHDDMAYYKLKDFELEYVQEISVGDKINVVCWEDSTNRRVIRFLVKTAEKTACRCRGEWYPDSNGYPTKIPNPKPFVSNL
ncbi:uncharacterized protein [Diadema antillarum]|uniref:uncharacterized protein n=1 Tax=Diadema antillarum TaxID=105358 RepID=UPI003A8A3722